MTSQKLASCDFWQIGNGKSAKVNLLFLFLNLWNGPEILQFVYWNLSKNSNIDDSEISLHIFPLELIQNYKILV